MRRPLFVRVAVCAQLVVCALFLLPSLPQAFSVQRSTLFIGIGTFERYGAAIAFGDYDGDGRDDLAVGIPARAANGLAMAGGVCLYFRSASTAERYSIRCVSQASLPSLGPAEPGDQFGSSLSFGDFDDDGFDDLAIGVPYANIWSVTNAGTVRVLYGNPDRSFQRSLTLFQGAPFSSSGSLEAGDRFGHALAAGDFDADGFDDLAVGVVGEDVNTIPNAGAVHVVYGGPLGLGPRDQVWIQDQLTQGTSELGDQFGYALTTGRFNADFRDDLAVGVPFEDWAGAVDSGVVHVLYGGDSGLTATSNQLWHQNVLVGRDEPGDRFGFAVAGGDLNADGIEDLAIGVPGENPCEASGCASGPNAGGVHVLQGGPGRLRVDGNAFYSDPSFLRSGDQYGYALTFGELHGDGIDDLVVGVPGRDVSVTTTYYGVVQASDAGAIVVVSGAATSNFNLNCCAYLHQNDSRDANLQTDPAEPGERFGSTLAAGRFDGDRRGDVAVGIPFQDSWPGGIHTPATGAVEVVWGPP